ncbi:MAG: FAD-binding oxidoreductase [Deltaproteobacteria bacterium]|nr:FAD-binding oxidoreductase [Deltaproteobacteria bacterium]
MFKRKGVRPQWQEKPPPAGSYRSIFKYGDPQKFKHPSLSWVNMLKADLGMTDEDFKARIHEGLSPVDLKRNSRLLPEHIEKFSGILGRENITTDAYERLKYACGKTTEEMMELSRGRVGEISDLVVHPRHKEDVRDILRYCNDNYIPIYPFSGGSSVTLGLRPEKGGVTLAMGTHMNRLLTLNETNQTATVQPGMMGPAFEAALNQAPERFMAKRRYTCGHFPQSFEYSTVGGWVAAFGSGQASTYYGDAADLVISQEYITPSGDFKTLDYPATATGPRLNHMMIGSEGTFGVLVEISLKIFRYQPDNRRYFSFMFPTWHAAVDSAREMAQGEFGRPAVYRISDPEETERGLQLYGLPSPVNALLKRRGFKPTKRSLCLGTVEGDRDVTRLVKHKIRRLAKSYGALYLGEYGAKKWEKTRYTEPMMREDLNDYGITIDTLETSVSWDRLHALHQGVRRYIKGRPQTICMTHASHFYSSGTNLYFIFIGRFESTAVFKQFHRGIIDHIQKCGGSLSHHHGVGRMMAPWMEAHLGTEQMAALRALKKHFDPNNIMNPGGQLGLDLPREKMRHS